MMVDEFGAERKAILFMVENSSVDKMFMVGWEMFQV